MIYDPANQFIFIQTLKVSGSSFEVAIAPFLSPRAIATISSTWDESEYQGRLMTLRRTSWLPLRHLIPQIVRYPHFARDIPSDLLKRRGPRHKHFSREKAHMPAEEIKHLIGEARWNECTKVEIARNPYQRLVSHYFMHRNPSQSPESFLSFRQWISQDPDLVVLNERLVSTVDQSGRAHADIDLIIYYEDMRSGLSRLAQRLSISPEHLINRYENTRIHSQYRPRDEKGRVENIIDAESKSVIDFLLYDHFKRLGYVQSFDDFSPVNRNDHLIHE